MEYTAIVLAAGNGTRMGLAKNKVFLTLNQRSILNYSLTVFAEDCDCKQLIVVGKTTEQDEIGNLSKPIDFVEGGKERQDSVYNGLAKVKSDYVMIHDGARPFILAQDLEALKKEVQKTQATLLAVPVKDTIKQVENRQICQTVPRDNLYQAQTPQVFKTELIQTVHLKAKLARYLGTDDTSLVEKFSETRVSITVGSYENIKITTPEDLYIAEAIMRRRLDV